MIKFRTSTAGNALRRVRLLARRFKSMSASELRDYSLDLRFQAKTGTALQALLPEAYALVREMASRKLGMRHYDVQVLAGIHLAGRTIVEMQTGEGKTLTATLPLFLYALLGRGAHLATSNDYLAERDAEIMRPLFEALGLSVGVITAVMNDSQRRAAYRCDITYGTLTEFGFDFLRDRVKLCNRSGDEEQRSEFWEEEIDFAKADDQPDDTNKPVMRDLFYLLADEADSLLVDEANTPLIIGAKGRLPAYEAARRGWASLHSDEALDNEHYQYELQSKKVRLTAQGRNWVRNISRNPILNQCSHLELYQAMERAIEV